MKYPLFSLAAAMMLNLAAPTVQAQKSREPLRIGYVNSDRVLRDAVPAKAALSRLETELAKRDKELKDAGERLKAAEDKLLKDGPTLPESERTRRERDLLEQQRELTRKRRDYQEDFNQRRNEETAAMFERAGKAIRQISEQEKYDLIMQDVVYANPRIDITDKVIRLINNAPAK